MPAELALLDAQQRPTTVSPPSPAALPVIGSFEPDRQKIVARYLSSLARARSTREMTVGSLLVNRPEMRQVGPQNGHRELQEDARRRS